VLGPVSSPVVSEVPIRHAQHNGCGRA
jgi:hypothetical protein